MTAKSSSASAPPGAAADLAQFGYKQQLHRSIGGYTSFALAFSMISVTTTVFTLFAEPFQALGGVAIWLWIPVGGGVVLISLVYGHLAARLPVTGYAYQWASRIVSPHYGWFTGWNAMLCTLVGSAGHLGRAGVRLRPRHLGGAHALGRRDARRGRDHRRGRHQHHVDQGRQPGQQRRRVHGTGRHDRRHDRARDRAVLLPPRPGTARAHPEGLVHRRRAGFDTIGLALLLPVWTLAGWEGSADLAEETTDPRRIAPRAMLRAVTISGAVAFIVYAVFAMAIPGDLKATVNGTANPMVAIFSNHFGGWAADLLQVIAFVAMLSCLLANITCATRTSFSLARDNMLPFSKTWSNVNAKTATPIYTILAVGVFAIAINLLSGGFVANVLAVVNVALYLTYGSTCVAVLIANRRGTIPDAPPGYFSLGRWLVPLSITCVVFSVAVIVFMIGPASSHVVLWYALGFQAAGVVWYAAAVRSRLRRGVAGPASTRNPPWRPPRRPAELGNLPGVHPARRDMDRLRQPRRTAIHVLSRPFHRPIQ